MSHRVRPLSAGSRALVSAMAVSGTIHLVRPAVFDRVVPRSMPGPARFWVLASGVAELACAAAMAVPRTRSLGGAASAALMIAVLPGNVRMARDARTPRARVVTLLRLPLQIPLVLWALDARRDS